MKNRNTKKLRRFFTVIVVLVFYSYSLYSQSALKQLEQAAGRSASSVYVPAASGPVPVGSIGSAVKSAASSSSSDMSGTVSGIILQSIINNLLNPTPQKSKEELEAEQKERERLEYEAEMKRQAELARQQKIHETLVNSSKQVTDAPKLDFKSLDGEAETIRKEAADQFEPKTEGNNYSKNTMGSAFFGLPLSDTEVQIAIDPENTPVVRDLKTSAEETREYLENEKDSIKLISKPSPIEARGEPIVEKPDCMALSEKLTRYRTDMMRFDAWNTGTLVELEKWQEQNDAAFWSAVEDGTDAAFGIFLDYLDETRKSAYNLKRVFEKDEAGYLRDKIWTAAQATEYKKLLDQRILTSNITKTVKEHMEIIEYVDQSRNLMQGTVETLAKSDGDCMDIINVLKNEGLLSDMPFVDAGQFLAGKVINKFLGDPEIVKKYGKIFKNNLKVQYVTIAQLIVDEGYNVTDWITSYQNICTLREADGRAADAMRKIRSDMNNIKIQLKECPAYYR